MNAQPPNGCARPMRAERRGQHEQRQFNTAPPATQDLSLFRDRWLLGGRP